MDSLGVANFLDKSYWLALVLMHPVGATIGNWISKPIGLNLGNVYTNLAMIVAFGGIYVLNERRLSENNDQSAS